MKTITFSRRELVWDEYRLEWTENDFEDLKAFLQNHLECSDSAKVRYDAIKNISFNELIQIIQRKKENIYWKIKVDVNDNSWEYQENLIDYITEIMREDSWSYGCTDSWSADDSEEELFCNDDEDENFDA